MVTAYLYDANGHDRELDAASITAKIPTDQLLWVDAERDDWDGMAAAAKSLGVAPEAIESLADPEFTGSIERFAAHYQFRLPIAPEHGKARDGRIDFLIGSNWLITIRDGDVPFLTEFRDQDKAETVIGNLTASLLAAALLYSHLESYFAAIAKIDTATDGLDEAVLAERKERVLLPRLAAMRRRVTALRRRLGDQRSVFHGLVRPELDIGDDATAREHFVSLERRFERAVDALDRARDSITSSFELFATKTAQDTNQLVKVLTLATVALGLVGAVAGVFGMNFQTRFSQTGETGFWLVVGSTVGVSVILAIVAKWRGWL